MKGKDKGIAEVAEVAEVTAEVVTAGEVAPAAENATNERAQASVLEQALNALVAMVKAEVDKLDSEFTTALAAAVKFGIISKEAAAEREYALRRERAEAIVREVIPAIITAAFGEGYSLFGLVMRDTGGGLLEITAPDWYDQYRVVANAPQDSSAGHARNNSNFTDEFIVIAQELCERDNVKWWGIATFSRNNRRMQEAMRIANERGVPIFK